MANQSKSIDDHCDAWPGGGDQAVDGRGRRGRAELTASRTTACFQVSQTKTNQPTNYKPSTNQPTTNQLQTNQKPTNQLNTEKTKQDTRLAAGDSSSQQTNKSINQSTKNQPINETVCWR